jgi:hypothetical protein
LKSFIRKSTASSSSRRGTCGRVERGLEEVAGAHAGDLDRVLEGEEDALAGALVGLQLEQVLAVVEDLNRR